MEGIIIGIDPDCKASGVCIYDLETGLYTLRTMSLMDIVELLSNPYIVHVGISAGWLNGSNWHTGDGHSNKMSAKIGERLGANHEIGKQIALFCQHLKKTYTLARPRGKKLNKSQLASLTGYSGQSNQDERDAAVVAYFVKKHIESKQ